MLNCLSQLPNSEMCFENQRLFLSLLYTHLENIPHIENPNHMVTVDIFYR